MQKHGKNWFALMLGLTVWMQVPVMGAQEDMSTEMPDLAKYPLDMATEPEKQDDDSDCPDGCPPD